MALSGLMSLLRKFAVLMLVVALTPAMVLSAMPVKLCKAFDGQHQALEFVIDGVFHGGNHGSHHDGEAMRAAHFDECGVATLIEPDTCIDSDLTQLAAVPATDLQFIELPTLGNSPLPQLTAGEPRPFAAQHIADSGRQRIDPRVSERRSTVLRI